MDCLDFMLDVEEITNPKLKLAALCIGTALSALKRYELSTVTELRARLKGGPLTATDLKTVFDSLDAVIIDALRFLLKDVFPEGIPTDNGEPMRVEPGTLRDCLEYLLKLQDETVEG